MKLALSQWGRNPWLDGLAAVFGMASWISVNGLWVELPVMVPLLPESWALASYLSVIIQIANLGPIIYAGLRWYLGDDRLSKALCINVLLSVGLVASILLIFFWDEQATIGGESHSVVLFILVFFLSLVDCTSSVLFLPFMAMFKATYLNSYLVGEGLSGLVPAVIALIQGVGGNPYCQNVTDENGTVVEEAVVPEARFSVEVFFAIISVMMFLSTLAFQLMNHIPQFKAEMVNGGNAYTKPAADDEETKNSVTLKSYKSTGETPSKASSDVDLVENGGLDEGVCFDVGGQFLILLALQFYLCFVSNSFLSSIQTYSTLPYGNTVYHLSVTLSSIANPLVAFGAFFFPTYSVPVMFALSVLGSTFAGFILATALNSPDMLLGQDVGGTLVVVSWVLYIGLFSYVKVTIAGWCRRRGKSSLFYFGALTQAGSAVGAVLAFVLVNETTIFEAYYVQCGDSKGW